MNGKNERVVVSTKIPAKWKSRIYKYLVGPGKIYNDIAEYIREVIRQDLEERGLIAREEEKGTVVNNHGVGFHDI